jgi:hypothetical protein
MHQVRKILWGCHMDIEPGFFQACPQPETWLKITLRTSSEDSDSHRD